MAVVPNNDSFTFFDVTLAVYGDTNAGRNLVSAFADAAGTFDPAYVGLKTNLLNFRNYNSTPTPPITYYGYTVNEYLAPYPSMTCTANGSRTIANTFNTAVIGKFYRSNNGSDDCVFEVLTSGVDISAGGYLITSFEGAGASTCTALLPLAPL
jgi:hypothetical protein